MRLADNVSARDQSPEQDLAAVAPLTRILCACLVDQVQSLARLYRAGVWRHDPSEINEWLSGRGVNYGKHPVQQIEARYEASLWCDGITEGLLDALASETAVDIDRGRIVALAKKLGAEKHARGKRVRDRKVRRVRKSSRVDWENY